MSIARVVTRGYGTFSDVNELPTRGYSIAAPAPSVIVPTPTPEERVYQLKAEDRIYRNRRVSDGTE